MIGNKRPLVLLLYFAHACMHVCKYVETHSKLAGKKIPRESQISRLEVSEGTGNQIVYIATGYD